MDLNIKSDKVHIREAEQGDAGYIAYMHGRLYKKLYNLGGTVEYYFMKTLTDFVYGHEGGKLWVAEKDGIIVGAIGIVKPEEGVAQLRWFIVDENCQNMGIGSALMKQALEFSREMGYSRIFLWTFSELDAARRVYQKVGFSLAEEKLNTEWRDDVITEQKWEMTL